MGNRNHRFTFTQTVLIAIYPLALEERLCRSSGKYLEDKNTQFLKTLVWIFKKKSSSLIKLAFSFGENSGGQSLLVSALCSSQYKNMVTLSLVLSHLLSSLICILATVIFLSLLSCLFQPTVHSLET